MKISQCEPHQDMVCQQVVKWLAQSHDLQPSERLCVELERWAWKNFENGCSAHTGTIVRRQDRFSHIVYIHSSSSWHCQWEHLIKTLYTEDTEEHVKKTQGQFKLDVVGQDHLNNNIASNKIQSGGCPTWLLQATTVFNEFLNAVMQHVETRCLH